MYLLTNNFRPGLIYLDFEDRGFRFSKFGLYVSEKVIYIYIYIYIMYVCTPLNHLLCVKKTLSEFLRLISKIIPG